MIGAAIATVAATGGAAVPLWVLIAAAVIAAFILVAGAAAAWAAWLRAEAALQECFSGS
jgi:hypothetical protein